MNKFNIGLDSNMEFLKKGIEVSTLRSKVIANNISNINTKDYKKFSVVFEENLKNNDSSLNLKRTNNKHISGNNDNIGKVSIQQSKETSMRNDGNNVDLEIEKVNQAANTLKYNAMITTLNKKFNELKSVIK